MMRYLKFFLAIAVALATVILVRDWLTPNQPSAETISENTPSLVSSGPNVPRGADINLWLMPDFAENRVWVDGDIFGAADQVQRFVRNQHIIPITATWPVTSSGPITSGYHIFGEWIDSEILTMTDSTNAAYALRLPGLDLLPTDTLNIKLASGLILSVTDAQAAPQVTAAISSPTVSTGTLAVTLTFTPTDPLTAADDVLTGGYVLDNAAFYPVSGPFVVTSTVVLTARYSLRTSSAPPLTEDPSMTALVTPVFTSTFQQLGDLSQIKLTDLRARPITLQVEFYPYKKDIDLALTPLLVETMMTHTASAYGGGLVAHFFSGNDSWKNLFFVRAGLVGHGNIYLHVNTVDTDAQRRAAALTSAFYQPAGNSDEKVAQDRLLERTLDFPSFPDKFSPGELNKYKDTIIEARSTVISPSLPAGSTGFSLSSSFRLNVWKRLNWDKPESMAQTLKDNLPISATLCDEHLPNYTYADLLKEKGGIPDFNRCIGGIGERQVMQLGLGRIMLGPRDVLTLTIDNVAWQSIDPPPNIVFDHWVSGSGGPERSGFTAVYNGPRSIGLNILYNPRPGLFAQQFVARIRGVSRSIEFWLVSFWSGITVLFCALVLHWMYIWPVKERQEKLWRPSVRYRVLRSALAAAYLLAIMILAHKDLGDRPIEVLIVGGTLLLVSGNTALSRHGLCLWLTLITALCVDFALNTLYFTDAQNALNFSSSTGALSGATSIAVLLELLGFLAVFVWQLRHREVRPADLQAFAFLGLTAATFDVQDASFFALLALYIAWLAFSLLLDHIGPALIESDGPSAPPEARSQSLFAPATNEDSGSTKNSHGANVKPLLQAATPQRSPSSQPQLPASAPHSKGAAAGGGLARLFVLFRTMFRRRGATSASVPPSVATLPSPTSAPNKDLSAVKHNPPLTERVEKLLQPVPIGALLIVAIVLSQDRLLRTQMVSFNKSTGYPLAWLLDPAAIFATTLVLAVAAVLLTLLLDAALTNWPFSADNRGRNILIRILLPITLFLIFLLGSGGLDIFTGAIDLRLSDRIIYYVTVPLLTLMWLEWKPVERKAKSEGQSVGKPEGMLWWLPQLANNLAEGQKLIRTILIVLSILIPQLVTSVSSEQFDKVIQILQSLQPR